MTLLHAIPKEREYLRSALIDGRVNGSQYEGECACLKGTLENACKRTASEMGLRHSIDEPAESFFLGINEGDTPETNQISKIVVEWLDEFQALISGEYATGYRVAIDDAVRLCEDQVRTGENGAMQSMSEAAGRRLVGSELAESIRKLAV